VSTGPDRGPTTPRPPSDSHAPNNVTTPGDVLPTDDPSQRDQPEDHPTLSANVTAPQQSFREEGPTSLLYGRARFGGCGCDGRGRWPRMTGRRTGPGRMGTRPGGVVRCAVCRAAEGTSATVRDCQ
jgi:hypothetical protein